MFGFLIKHKGLVVFPSIVLLFGVMSIIGFLVIDVDFVCAHSPHDLIDALEISPTYQHDKTLFVVTNDHLLRSTDGGFAWKKLAKGLDNQGALTSIAISPNFDIDRTVLVSSNGDGIYKSEDRGNSWDKINQGLDNLEIDLLVISPRYATDGIILAAGTEGGLYQTNDAGQSWHEVIDEGVKVTAIAFSSDLKRRLVVVGDDESQLWFSDVEGETWQKRYQIPEGRAITTIAISDQFSADGTFFVGTEQRGVFRTVDGGTSFVELGGGPSRYSVDFVKRHLKISPPDKHIVSLALSPNYGQDGTIFASTWYEAVFESNDGGLSWTKHETGITCDKQANSEAYKSSHFRQLRVSRTFAEDGTIFLAGFDGLFKSAEGGRIWRQLETLPLRLIMGLGLSPANGNDFAVTIATYGGGAYTTTNQGATWTIDNAGLKTTRLVDVTYSPSYNSDHTVFSGASEALLKSTDGAHSWERIELDVVANRGRPYPTFIVLSPNYAADQTLYFGTRRHGVLKSTDGGLTSGVIWDGKGQVIEPLIISPDFIVDGTLFASVRGEGVYITEDRGETWQAVNEGFSFLETWQSVTSLEETNKDVVLVISPNYGQDKTLFAGSSGADGLFKTTNGGVNWQKLSGAGYGENSHIIGIGISPNYENDETLIISVKSKGLFKSVDGGLTFTEIGEELIDDNHAITFIEFSPLYASDETIYAAYVEEIFRSTDGGHSWELMSRPVRYENMREVVYYEGSWKQDKGRNYSATSVTQSDAVNSTASLSFVGTGVSWIGLEGNDQGIAKVYIDGNYVGDVDQFNDTPAYMATSFSVTDLDYGWHTIVVEVTDEKNPASAGYRIAIDAFDITP